MPFSDLHDRVAVVNERIREAADRGGHGQRVRIVAVTKTHSVEAVRAALDAGIQDVGENRIQEALGKIEEHATPAARWHLLGHLQRNKVKFLEPFHMVHSLDSTRIAESIDSWAVSRGTCVNVLLQVNVSGEDTKGGFLPEAVAGAARGLRSMKGLKVCGVMTMAPYEAPERTLREVFSGAREARDVLLSEGHPAEELSMGMSGDYEIAVEEGATMVRLGTILFGARS
ncbi:MAG TPA: YggS family pyridoxal phosphate-dependent enzyme [Gemmatimonadales bacterium]|nr:YggS family pyridoxal phosphate-dependent enzyme [Gemmatimonadales bacterium]